MTLGGQPLMKIGNWNTPKLTDGIERSKKD